MKPSAPMPRRTDVDPAFDGHLERPLREMTVSERIDWIWAGMLLLNTGRKAREPK